jgi:hypothetical protein
LTVYNVCHLNPGIGTYYSGTVSEGWPGPTAYWLDSKGNFEFFAASTDGDAAVDIAIISTADETDIAYFARCSWSNWLTIAEWDQLRAQSGVPAAQAGSLAYLEEVTPANDALSGLGSTYFTPSVGVSVCQDDSAAECEYDPGG